nr:hypothetical protein [Candidatus Gracilibacteria bacterium]
VKKISKKGRMWAAFVSSQHGAVKKISKKGRMWAAFVSSQHGAAKNDQQKRENVGGLCVITTDAHILPFLPLLTNPKL